MRLDEWRKSHETEKQEASLVGTSGECLSYTEWKKDGHREYCTSPGGHDGAHRVEGGGPGAWWFGDVYSL